MKNKLLLCLLCLLLCATQTHAVLKEKDLDHTLSILRSELTDARTELERQATFMQRQQQEVFQNLMDILNKSNQNSLMLYSQKPDYIFDLTYACHEATEQYAQYQKNVLPFKSFLDRTQNEMARYDSLIVNLSQMRVGTLSEKAKTDRNICLTLAVSIRRTLRENSEQLSEYINIYKRTEEHLRTLNAYANLRYADIQNSIFKNGGENFFQILSHLGAELRSTTDTVSDKYKPARKVQSQWDSSVILRLFGLIFGCAFIALLLNYVVIAKVLRRWEKKPWHARWIGDKQTGVVLTATVITLALALAVIRLVYKEQNFIIMASKLLVEYTWLLGVILMSLLVRLGGRHIMSAFRIYAPLIFIGFVVISFRIVLIPNDLVNLIFPPILLVCTCWQWRVIRRHNNNIPRSDVFYTYISLAVFVASLVSSWTGYTLLSVQMLIWWIMQLTCILTITCIQGLIKNWADRRQLDQKPITQTWAYRFVYDVLLPVMGVASIVISIYWAADVFNLSDTTWSIFRRNYINTQGFSVSIFAICQIVTLYFLCSYVSHTAKELLKLYFEKSDHSTAASRNVMGKNIVQLVVWGAWLLISMSILHVDKTWLVVISGGLSTGIGFAMKDIIENIYYGISLMAGRVKIGDWIEVGGTRGRVSSISYTSTMVDTIDGSVIAFQNSQLFTQNYKNMTKNHGYELDILEVGVAYGTDIARAKQLLVDAISQLDCVSKSRPVRIVLKSFSDSSITLKILVWVPVLTQYHDDGVVLECVYRTLNDNGIEIPFPQRDIHIIHEREVAEVPAV